MVLVAALLVTVYMANPQDYCDTQCNLQPLYMLRALSIAAACAAAVMLLGLSFKRRVLVVAGSGLMLATAVAGFIAFA